MDGQQRTSDQRERDHATWRKGVASVLAKSRKVDVSELPAEPETLLTEDTYDGVPISPLYTRFDEHAEQPLPGEWPFTRGGDRDRDVNAGWKVSQRFGENFSGDTEALSHAIVEALGTGVSAVELRVGPDALAPTDLDGALRGMLLDLAPLHLETCGEPGSRDSAVSSLESAARALFAVLDDRATGSDTYDPASVTITLGADQHTANYIERATLTDAELTSVARTAAERVENIRAVTIDGAIYHGLGASDAQEIGVAIASATEHVRTLLAAGLSPEQAFGQISFRFAVTDEQFAVIAKLRAARHVWARVAQVAGAPEAGNAPQLAVTSLPMMTQRDPWVNMLRTTLAAFGAGVGGADSVTVLPFDEALPTEVRTVSPSFAQRIARNTQLLLLEESHLGRVLDPAAGSWYVEDLTRQLADQAWAFFQQIEAAGGFAIPAAKDLVAAAIMDTRTRRESDIAHRRKSITGVNEFPNLGENPLPPIAETSLPRYAVNFERLRDRADQHLAQTGTRPTALLVPLGPVAEHNVRTTFAANLLASGGVLAANPGPLALDQISAAVRESGTTIVVICATDARYRDELGDAVAAVREGGATVVYLAGSAKVAVDLPDDRKPDTFLTMGIDAVAALSALLTELGA